MTCAMLLEISNISRNEFYIKNNIISRPFRKLIDSADSALFNGPPEHPRDYVVYAARCLYHGEWKKALDYLLGATKVWKLIPESDIVQKILEKEVKEVAFKVLLFRNSEGYQSYSIKDLGALFELSEGEIHKLASKMIVRERFGISVKKSENSIQINEKGLNEVQNLTNVLLLKAKSIIDSNQRLATYPKQRNGSPVGFRNAQGSKKEDVKDPPTTG